MWESATGTAALATHPALQGFFGSVGDIVECDSAGTFLVVTGEERIRLVYKFAAAQPAIAIIVEIAEVGVLEHRVRLSNGLEFLGVILHRADVTGLPERYVQKKFSLPEDKYEPAMIEIPEKKN
jgi:hypothetical protein